MRWIDFIILLLLVQPVQVAFAVSGGDRLSNTASVLEAIAASPFDEPVYMESEEREREAHGQVHSIVEGPLEKLREAVGSPQDWCEILFLHLNVKACVHQSRADAAELRVYMGKRYYQDPQRTEEIRLGFHVDVDDRGEERLAISLLADRGPYGIRDFQIEVRAVPLDEERSLVRMDYSVGYGALARLAMRGYFATGGRHRIGFTRVDSDVADEPVHVGGIRGMIERNTLRFFYALSAYLLMPEPDQQEARLTHWFELTERHPGQLREIDKDTYLEQKRRERRDQEALQAKIDG
ncbi:MAG: hypothetical protein ACFCVA_13005 [Gammaproteobacteria bacterium]